MVSVPNSGAYGIFPVGVVQCNPAVKYNVAVFSELSFAGTSWGSYVTEHYDTELSEVVMSLNIIMIQDFLR